MIKIAATHSLLFYCVAAISFTLYVLNYSVIPFCVVFIWMFIKLNKLEKVQKDFCKREELLTHAAHHDPLTGLLNRTGYETLVQSLKQQSCEANAAFGLIYVDLDDFKQINDLYGHSTGDKVLVEVANQLKDIVRQKDLVARLGGDEFVVIILSSPTATKTVYERVATLCSGFNLECISAKLTASVGVTVYPSDGPDILNNADQAMYEAKKSGKNKFVFYSKDSKVD